MPLKQPLIFAIFNMDYSKKFTKIESDSENKSETPKCKKRLSSINVIFSFSTQSFFKRYNLVFVSDVSVCFFVRNRLFLNVFILV